MTNDDGTETPDSIPMRIVLNRPTPTMVEIVRQMIRSERAAAFLAQQQEYVETWEQADDFDVSETDWSLTDENLGPGPEFEDAEVGAGQRGSEPDSGVASGADERDPDSGSQDRSVERSSIGAPDRS